MKLSDLQDFFDGKLSATSLHENILPEVQEYERLCKVKGSTNPITVINDAEIIVSSRSVSRLCTACLNLELPVADVSYIADALLLANVAQDVAFQREELTELLGQLTDPEINGPITRETILGVLAQLQG